MATVAMVTKILSQSPTMATLALKWHMDGCRRMERGILSFLAFFGIRFEYGLLKRSGKIEMSVTMLAKMLPW